MIMPEDKRTYVETESEKVLVLCSFEMSGNVAALDRLLRNQYGDLANANSLGIRTKFKQWQEIARKGLEIEEAWGRGALLDLTDPHLHEMVAQGIVPASRIAHAEAYNAAGGQRLSRL